MKRNASFVKCEFDTRRFPHNASALRSDYDAGHNLLSRTHLPEEAVIRQWSGATMTRNLACLIECYRHYRSLRLVFPRLGVRLASVDQKVLRG